jgi:PAS domain-containing protein
MRSAVETSSWLWPAVFGLVGVVIGSIITAGFEWWRERARLRRAQLLAARRMRAVLGRAGEAIDQAIEVRDGSPRLKVRGVVTTWDAAMRDLFDLSHDDWIALDRCSNLFAVLEGSTPENTSLNDESLEALGRLRADASRGVTTLDRLAQ